MVFGAQGLDIYSGPSDEALSKRMAQLGFHRPENARSDFERLLSGLAAAEFAEWERRPPAGEHLERVANDILRAAELHERAGNHVNAAIAREQARDTFARAAGSR